MKYNEWKGTSKSSCVVYIRGKKLNPEYFEKVNQNLTLFPSWEEVILTR